MLMGVLRVAPPQKVDGDGTNSGMFVLGIIFHPFTLMPLETKCIQLPSSEMSGGGGTMGSFPQAGLAAWRQTEIKNGN